MDREWSIPFLSENPAGSRDWALIVLNQPFHKPTFDTLWRFCRWRIFADGGANRVYDSLDETSRSIHLPDLIKGDLDSARNEVIEYYKSQGTTVVEDSDQYATDLMKCVDAVVQIEKDVLPNGPQIGIIMLGGLAGRIDQTVHTMSQLHKLRVTRHVTYVVTEESIAWALDTGKHIIHVDRTKVGPTCGLLPLGIDSTILTTRGLQWNLDKTESSFDGMVSTSNAFVSDEIIVETTRPIIWCVELRKTP